MLDAAAAGALVLVEGWRAHLLAEGLKGLLRNSVHQVDLEKHQLY